MTLRWLRWPGMLEAGALLPRSPWMLPAWAQFALATPGAKSSWLNSGLLGNDSESTGHEPGDLAMRSNIAAREDNSLVPGEVLYRFSPSYFRVERNPPQIQVEERLYYEPCSLCGRASNDPHCRCASALTSQHSGTTRPSA